MSVSVMEYNRKRFTHFVCNNNSEIPAYFRLHKGARRFLWQTEGVFLFISVVCNALFLVNVLGHEEQ